VIPVLGLSDTVHVTVTPRSDLGVSAAASRASARYPYKRPKKRHKRTKKSGGAKKVEAVK
jgi:hypothetical protein